MKRKFLALLIGVAANWSWADDRTFAAGTLIIPMDSQTQNTVDDGIFRAYGLIYQLLGQGFTVYSVIDPDKTDNEQPDLTLTAGEDNIEVVSGANYLPTSPDAIPNQYLGGPFVVDASEAEAVLALITQSSPDFDTVVIHRFKKEVTAPIGEIYDVVPKKIALLESFDAEGESLAQSVLVCYLELAGVPPESYDILTMEDIAAGQLIVGTYYILWMPHWLDTDQADSDQAALVLQRIKEFGDKGGNIMATCKAIDSLEGSDPLMVSHSLGINGTNLGPTVYQHHDIPFSQIGDYPFIVDETTDTQNIRNWRVGDTTEADSPQNSTWKTNTSLVASAANQDGSAPQHPWSFYTLRQKDDDPEKGNLHFITGHQYASCKPTIVPGTVYRMATTMSSCKNGNSKTAFWDTANPTIQITLRYDGGDEEISIRLAEGDYTVVTGNEFEIWTEDPAADPDRFGTNYGPGCQGGGNPNGTDHLDGIFIRNLTQDSNIIIKTIEVQWSCNGSFGISNGCGETYQFEQFDIKTDNGNCGNSSCDQCTNVFGSGNKSCEADGEIEFTPVAKRNSDLAFDGGIVEGENGEPTPGNIGGLRYIYNTLFNKIVNPLTVAEFARSGPVVEDLSVTDADTGEVTKKTFVFFGTFEFPGNAGHLRAYEAEGTGSQLTQVWDAADHVPAFTERNLFTFINGSKEDVSLTNASTINSYIADPLLSDADTAENIQALRGKYRFKRLGGIERSTPAIVPPNTRVNPNRTGLAYVGTTFGLVEMINLTTGEEFGGYVPATLLSKLPNTGVDDPNRPKVDSSPTVLDAFLLKNGSTTDREWKTVLLVGHGSSAPGISALDISDPSNIKLLWEKFNTSANPNMYGYTQRISVAKYKKTVKVDGADILTLGYAAVVSSNIPDNANLEKGMLVSAYDLKTGDGIWATGDLVWPEAVKIVYTGSVSNQNDIPAPVAVWDYNQDGFDDRIFIGDLAGRLWQVDVQDGSFVKPPHKNSKSDPFFDTASATDLNIADTAVRPIAATPSIGSFNGKAVVAFGTGGADWTSASHNVVVVQDIQTGDLIFDPPIDIGARKIFSPVVIAGDRVFFTAVAGSLSSPDPTLDVPAADDDPTLLFSAYFADDGSVTTTSKTVSKARSSVYIDHGQAFSGGFQGELVRHGTKKDQNTIQALRFLIWQDLTNKVP